MVQWWGFVALFVDQSIKIRVVVRKVGKDKLHFWSVMLYPNDYGPILLKRGTGKPNGDPGQVFHTLLTPVASTSTNQA